MFSIEHATSRSYFAQRGLPTAFGNLISWTSVELVVADNVIATAVALVSGGDCSRRVVCFGCRRRRVSARLQSDCDNRRREWPAERCRTNDNCLATLQLDRWTPASALTTAMLTDCQFGVRVTFQRTFNRAPSSAVIASAANDALNYDADAINKYTSEIVAFLGAATLRVEYVDAASPQDMALRAMLAGKTGSCVYVCMVRETISSLCRAGDANAPRLSSRWIRSTLAADAVATKKNPA